MSLHPMLLDLQREPCGLDAHQNKSFVLSLRDQAEFSPSNKHSFGLHKVPHIGKFCKSSPSSICCMGLLCSKLAVQLLPRVVRNISFFLTV